MCSDGMGFSCLLLSLFVSAPGKSGSSEELPFRKQSVRFPSGLVVVWCGWSSGFYEQVKGGVRGLSIAQNSGSAGVRFELICRGRSSNPPGLFNGTIYRGITEVCSIAEMPTISTNNGESWSYSKHVLGELVLP